MSVRRMAASEPGARRQSGAALLAGLLILIVALLLGITATSSTIMQERMAGNFRDDALAFQAAEAGNRWAATWLQSRTHLTRPFPCAAGCGAEDRVWMVGQYPYRPDRRDSTWETAGHYRWYGLDPGTNLPVDPPQSYPMVSTQPRYIMEQQYFQRDDLSGPPFLGVAYYRVTSLGRGARDSSAAIVSALVAKRYQ